MLGLSPQCPIHKFFSDKSLRKEYAISRYVEVNPYKEINSVHKGYKFCKVEFVPRFSRPFDSSGQQEHGAGEARNALGGLIKAYTPSHFEHDLPADAWGDPTEVETEVAGPFKVIIKRKYTYGRKKFSYGYVVYKKSQNDSEWFVLREHLDMYNNWYQYDKRVLSEEDMSWSDIRSCDESYCVQWGDAGYGIAGYTIYTGRF